MEPMPIVTLTNGIRIGNHSSPHTFTFEDGTVLPACSDERALTHKLQSIENRSPSPCGRWTDIDLKFALPAISYRAVKEDAANPDVDVILVALPMLICLRNSDWLDDENVRRKVRCIRRTERTGNIIHIDRFCI